MHALYTVNNTDIKTSSMKADAAVIWVCVIVKVHWVFSVMVLSPPSLADMAKQEEQA